MGAENQWPHHGRVPKKSIEPPIPDIFLSPNHGGVRPETKGVILHSTRSGRTVPNAREEEYGLTVNYFLAPGTPASAHRVIGVSEGQHALMVEDEMMAWHVAEDNTRYLGIEFCQPLPTDEYSDWQLEEGALTVAFWSKEFGFNVNTDTCPRHQDTAQGKRSGKSDVGNKFPYIQFLNRCRAIREML